MEYRLLTINENQTLSLGAKIAGLLRAGDVVAFFGDLGSGKTCLIQGICKGLGVKEQVTSPTFTLINEYINGLPVYHFDFYRINSEAEIFGLGYEEYFYGNGLCLIEWADRVSSFLPGNRIEIHLKSLFEQEQENHREIWVKIVGRDLQSRDWTSVFITHQWEGQHIENSGY